MHPQQQQALYQHHQQYPGAPPSYDQAMAHPMPGAHAMQQAQNWVNKMPIIYMIIMTQLRNLITRAAADSDATWYVCQLPTGCTGCSSGSELSAAAGCRSSRVSRCLRTRSILRAQSRTVSSADSHHCDACESNREKFDDYATCVTWKQRRLHTFAFCALISYFLVLGVSWIENQEKKLFREWLHTTAARASMALASPWFLLHLRELLPTLPRLLPCRVTRWPLAKRRATSGLDHPPAEGWPSGRLSSNEAVPLVQQKFRSTKSKLICNLFLFFS